MPLIPAEMAARCRCCATCYPMACDDVAQGLRCAERCRCDDDIDDEWPDADEGE